MHHTTKILAPKQNPQARLDKDTTGQERIKKAGREARDSRCL